MAGVASNVPVLPSRDLDRSASFYARLGYEVASRFPGYLILSHGGIELHLALMDVEPSRNPSGVYLRVSGLDEMARRLDAIPEDMPWGQREVALADPDGNLVRLGERIPG